MDSVDLEVLKASARWIESGRRVLLATVVRTWGSSPRPEGAMLAICDDGSAVGSVSGGCIEDDMIDRVRRLGIEQTCPTVLKYGISADEAHRFGLPCGGTIELVLEPLTRTSGIDELCRRVDAGQLVTRAQRTADPIEVTCEPLQVIDYPAGTCMLVLCEGNIVSRCDGEP